MLAGKIAIVTGSATGIGLGIAQRMIKEGAKVVMNGIQPHSEIKTSLANLPSSSHIYVQNDVGIKAEVDNLLKCSKQAYGKVDILVNSAGIQHIAPITEFPQQMWQKILQVNLTACFYTTKSVLPIMQAQRWGRIVNISSVHGLVASVNKSAYVAAKHGLIGFTKATALENCKFGITCNAICPGWVMTQLIRKQIELKAKQLNMTIEQAEQKLVQQKQPSGKSIPLQQLTNLTTLLCSEQSSQLTGSSYQLDGGWTAQ